jgi:outer membrane lipoprotein
MRSFVLAIAALALAGCATAPRPLQGEFIATSPEQASAASRSGDRVRWGGQIVATETRPDRTCLEMLAKPLMENARPRGADVSDGRFFACRSGFYDPALFAPGREVTVTGVVEGFEERPIGDYMYRYPRVAVDVLYLWPERTVEHRYYHMDPFWPHHRAGPWGPWGPHWYPRRIIVRPPPPPPPQ